MQGERLIDTHALAQVRRVSSELDLVANSAVERRLPGFCLVTSGRIPDVHLIDRPYTIVSFPIRGRSTVHCRHAGRSFDFVTRPGGFSILPGWGGYGVGHASPVEVLSMMLTPAQLQAIVEREGGLHATGVELIPTWHRTDPAVVELGQAFAALLRSPHRGSSLYAESLWTQIALKLLWAYSTLPSPQAPAVERLSSPRIRRVVDFMQATLAEDVGLSDLAAVAGLSPNYFLSAFRKATGKTPHRYRTELRIERACDMLRNPLTPIIQVALAVGYSSQSHLTTVFRRVVGVTPATYRARLLDLKTGDGSDIAAEVDPDGDIRQSTTFTIR